MMNSLYLILGIVGLLIGGLGLIFLIIALVNRNKANAAKAWGVTGGVVRSVNLREVANTDSESSMTYFRPEVMYDYSVAGVNYSGTRISFGANQFDRGTAQKIADKYQPGASVSVHYDPARPDQAVLETEAKSSNGFLIVGAVLLVIGLCLCCVGGGIAVFTISQTSSIIQ